MIGMGTMINVGAVVIGSLIGMVLGERLEKRFQDILMQVLGIATMFIGLSGTLKEMFAVHSGKLETTGTMLLILSLVIGSFIGEKINIEEKMESTGEWLKSKLKAQNDSQFVNGFVTATLVICIGAMAVVGSIEDGLRGDPSTLVAKSILDFVIVMVFASTLGIGVLFSALPLGIYQGVITIFSSVIAPLFDTALISDLSLVGSALIFAVGVNLSFGKKFRVGNMLPSLFVPVVYGLLIRMF